MRRSVILAMLFSVTAALAQVGPYLRPSKLNVPHGSTRPATCVVGDFFADDSQTPGQNIYYCTAANTWTLASGSGGGAPSALYAPPSILVYRSGINTVARSTADDVGLYSGTDPGAALQAAIDAIPTIGGTILVKPGSYAYTTTVPELPPNLTGTLSIIGYGAKITLSATAKYAFLVDKNADFDVFYGHHIEGFEVDGNSIDSTGNALYGGADGTFNRIKRVSWDRIKLINNYVYNLPSVAVSGKIREAVEMGSYQNDSTDTTVMYMRNILIAGNRVEGGAYGFHIVGSNAGSGAAGTSTFNCSMDNIVARDNVVTFPVDGSGRAIGAGANGFHIGGHCGGGTVTLENNTVSNPGDTGFEVNGAQTVSVRNCTVINPFIAGFLATNFSSSTVDASKQSYVYDNCAVHYTVKPLNTQLIGFDALSGTSGGVARYSLGTVTYNNCKFTSSGLTDLFGMNAVAITSGVNDHTGGIRAVNINNFNVNLDMGYDDTAVTGTNVIYIAPDGQDWDGDGTRDLTPVTIDGVKADFTLTKGTGSGARAVRIIQISGDADISISNFTGNVTVTGAFTSADTATGVYLGGSTSIVQGVIKDSRWSAQGEIGASYFLNIATGTTIPTDILVSHVDTTNTHNTTNLGDLNLTSPFPASVIISNNNLRTTPVGTKATPQPNVAADYITATVSATTPLVSFTDPSGNNPMFKRRELDGSKRIHFTTATDTNYPFKSYLSPDGNQVYMQQIPNSSEAAQANAFYSADWGANTTGNAATALYAINRGTGTTTMLAADRASNLFTMYLRQDASGNVWFAEDAGTHVLDLPQSTAGTLISGYADNSFPQTSTPLGRLKDPNQDFWATFTWNPGVATANRTYNWQVDSAVGCSASGNGGALTMDSSNNIKCVDMLSGSVTGAGNSFTIIESGASDPVADSTADTLTLTGTTPITVTGASDTDSVVFAIADALADGTTKGAATYAPADFNADGTGRISIDYPNGLEGDGTLDGFISAANWTTFNAKQAALTNSAGLAAALSNETGTDLAVFSTSPAIMNPTVTCTGCLTDTNVSDTLTSSLFVGSGSTTTAVDLATAEAAGFLAVAKAGNGAAPSADDQIVVSSSTSTAAWKSIPDCDDTLGQHVNYDTASNAFTCGVSGFASTAATTYTVHSGSSPTTGDGFIIGTTGTPITLLRNASGNLALSTGLETSALDGERGITFSDNTENPEAPSPSGKTMLHVMAGHAFLLANAGATPGLAVIAGTGVATYGPVLWAAASTTCTTVCGSTMARLTSCIDAYPMAGGAAVGCASTTAVRVCQCN